MNLLSVPYVRQNLYMCGGAVLEMIYRYYGLNAITQDKIFELYKRANSANDGFWILITDLIKDASARGYKSFQFNLTNVDGFTRIKIIKDLIEEKIPLIVCQQWQTDRAIGHYRVVIGIDDKLIYFHDPDIPNNRGFMRWNYERFLPYWENGRYFTGHLGMIVCKEEDCIPESIVSYILKY